MSLRESGNGARVKTAGLALAVLLAISGCSGGATGNTMPASSAGAGSSSTHATVVRVIDGDTFKASIEGEEKTVRLLNVDTPETKDPTAPVECMGPEATKALEDLLPVGTKVRLELDVEPLDKYGRTLAGVYDSGGKLINAEIARLGLGVPVLIEPNKKFYPPVVAAFDEASADQIGLNSADIPCLPAQQTEQAARAVDAIIAAPLSDSVSDLDQSHTALATALAALATLKAASSAKDKVLWAVYKPTKLAALVDRLDAATAAGSARQTAIGTKKKELAEASAAAAAQQAAAAAAAAQAAAEAEAARQAAAATAAAQAAAEAERIRKLPPAPAPYVPPAPAPHVPPAYVPPAPANNPYPGYTGPRCYAPGGKTWTPCSKK